MVCGFIEGRYFGQQHHFAVVDGAFVGNVQGFIGLHGGHKAVVQLGQTVVVHAGTFVVEAKAGCEDPLAQFKDGLVEKSDIPGANEEIRVYGHGVVAYFQIADVLGDILVGVVQHEGLNAVALEGDGGPEVIELVEGKKAGRGVPGIADGVSEDGLCREGGAVLALLQGEDGNRSVVLVHVHVVGEKLEGSGGVQRVFVTAVTYAEAVDEGKALVAGFVVVGRVLAFSVYYLIVGKTAFLVEPQHEYVGEEEVFRCRLFPLPAGRQAVVGITVGFLVGVVEEAVAVAVGEREYVGASRVVRAGSEDEAGLCGGRSHSGFEGNHRTGIVKGGEGTEGQYASHGVTAIQGALGTAQQGCAADGLPVHVVSVLVQNGNTVYIKPHNGVLHAGTKTSQIDGRGERCAVVRNVKAGHLRAQGLRTVCAGLVQYLLP